MTLMHYLCKVIASKSPELLNFHKDLVSLEEASKVLIFHSVLLFHLTISSVGCLMYKSLQIQLKFLAEEMQALTKGLEKVQQELSASENDGPVSEVFRKTLKEFIVCAEMEVQSLTSFYSAVGISADALALYFGEDPARCPFEQVISTLSNFVRLFVAAHQENVKQLEFERKKAEKEAQKEKMKLQAPARGNAK
ncbi:Formin-like protein 6 [Nymphaea thermarum]|nr:Formin-like protein 6 [Nymphaea thermarum]